MIVLLKGLAGSLEQEVGSLGGRLFQRAEASETLTRREQKMDVIRHAHPGVRNPVFLKQPAIALRRRKGAVCRNAVVQAMQVSEPTPFQYHPQAA